MIKPIGLALACGFALYSTAGLADPLPPQNVDPNKHVHLAQAQRSIDVAYKALEEAQKSNHYDMGGHIANARQLLEQADAEIKQAALTANEREKEQHR